MTCNRFAILVSAAFLVEHRLVNLTAGQIVERVSFVVVNRS